MASGYGMLGHVLWNMQTSGWGTAQVTSYSAIPIISENFRRIIDQLPEAGIYGRFAESPYQTGPLHNEGDLVMEISPTAAGHVFKSVIGQVTTVSGATGIQTHTFDPLTTDFVGGATGFTDRSAITPVTITVHRDASSGFQYYDMVGDRLQIEAANGQLVKTTLSMMGAGFARVAPGTPSFPSTVPFKWDQASVTWGSIAVPDFRNLTWNISNNLELQYTLTPSGAPYRVKRSGHFQVEVTGTMVFAQNSYYEAFLNQTEIPLVAHFAGTAPNALTIDIPALRLKTYEPVISGAGIVEAAFTAQAMYSTASANTVRITLVNTTAAWY